MSPKPNLNWQRVDGHEDMVASVDGLTMMVWRFGSDSFGFKLMAGHDAVTCGHATSMPGAMRAAEGRAEVLLATPIKDRAKIAIARSRDGVDRWALNRLLEDYERLEAGPASKTRRAPEPGRCACGIEMHQPTFSDVETHECVCGRRWVAGVDGNSVVWKEVLKPCRGQRLDRPGTAPPGPIAGGPPACGRNRGY